MHYAIGSISKQFTLAAVMLLQQEGSSRSIIRSRAGARAHPRARGHAAEPDVAHLRLPDYAPQDYTIPDLDPADIGRRSCHEWATKPLDFDPGTQYQYSNTNFNILGLIVEKASGQPFWNSSSPRVLQPVGLRHTIDLDAQRDLLEPIGYFRNALGPLRPAIPEAPGWYFADGELAMPVGDLLPGTSR